MRVSGSSMYQTVYAGLCMLPLVNSFSNSRLVFWGQAPRPTALKLQTMTASLYECNRSFGCLTMFCSESIQTQLGVLCSVSPCCGVVAVPDLLRVSPRLLHNPLTLHGTCFGLSCYSLAWFQTSLPLAWKLVQGPNLHQTLSP